MGGSAGAGRGAIVGAVPPHGDGGQRLSTYVDGAITIAVAVALAVGGLIVARKRLSYSALQAHHDVAAAIYTIAGTIYAVLLAFAVIIVWQAFTDTQSTVAQEANAVSDLERMSRGFPTVIQRQLHEAALTYAHVVVVKEWPLMAQGKSSEQANAALIDLWHTYTDMQELNQSSALYSESLTQLNEITNDRRLRLLDSENRIPTLMWAMLLAGGVIIVVFTYLFAVKTFWHHAAMVVMLSGMIAFAVFLIFALNGPFAGNVKVQPTPFITTIQNMEHVDE